LSSGRGGVISPKRTGNTGVDLIYFSTEKTRESPQQKLKEGDIKVKKDRTTTLKLFDLPNPAGAGGGNISFVLNMTLLLPKYNNVTRGVD